MSDARQQFEAAVRHRTAELLQSNATLRGDAARHHENVATLKHRLSGLQADALKDRSARRAALNLIEDAVLARDALAEENAERRRAEEDLAVELTATRLLHSLAIQLIRDDNSGALYQEILDTAVALMGSEMGSLQVHDEANHALLLLASHGLRPEWAREWATVTLPSSSICAQAFARGERVLVADVEADDMVAEEGRDGYRLRGICAVQSTPLIARSGRVVGLISTYWSQVHEPGERELRALDLLARQAADALERKETENALRESEARQAFLLKLSDHLRPLADAGEVQTGASRILGEQLKIDRVNYAEVREGDFIVAAGYHGEGVPDIDGRHLIARFGHDLQTELRAGRTMVSHDVHADANLTDAEKHAYDEIGVRSFVAVPLLKGGRLIAALGATQVSARHWTRHEIGLVEEMAERTWAAVERARAEEALRASEARLEIANKTKERFFAILSHELRTPLTPVLMAVGALQQDASLSADVRDDLAMIKRNVDIEIRLIDELLDLTRLNSGKVSLALRPVDLNEVMNHVCEICEPDIHERHIELNCQLDPGCGRVSADSVRLQQALWNVLRNAVKFTPSRGRIVVSTARGNGSHCEVRVQDNGVGIKPEVLPRIFDVFEQGDASITRLYGGLGLGLAITKSLIELHGGTIRAESAGSGKGASFILELPCLQS